MKNTRPELPVGEVHRLISALNGANAAMKKFYETLGLHDVKSTALQLMMEELGLAEPERWTWALRARAIA